MSKGDPVGRGGRRRRSTGRRPVRKKKTREAGLFFLVPTSQVMLHPKWVKKPFPAHVRSPILSVCLIKSKLYVDRRRLPGLGVFSRAGPNVSQCILHRCWFLDTVPLAKRCLCQFLPILDVRTIYRYHAKIALLAGHASPVMIKWCLNEQENCSASWPCLACQVVFE